MKISKVDAARRQINTAIELYFDNRDLVAIHTLICSADHILKDLNSALKKDGWRDWAANLHPHISETELRKILHHSYNFLKHADRGSTDKLDLNPHINETLLILVIHSLALHTKTTFQMDVFEMWFYAKVEKFTPESEQVAELFKVAHRLFPSAATDSETEYKNKGLSALRDSNLQSEYLSGLIEMV